MSKWAIILVSVVFFYNPMAYAEDSKIDQPTNTNAQTDAAQPPPNHVQDATFMRVSNNAVPPLSVVEKYLTIGMLTIAETQEEPVGLQDVEYVTPHVYSHMNSANGICNLNYMER